MGSPTDKHCISWIGALHVAGLSFVSTPSPRRFRIPHFSEVSRMCFYRCALTRSVKHADESPDVDHLPTYDVICVCEMADACRK